jgi:hypothetical protein
MNPAASYRRPTSAIIAALKDIVTALQLPDGFTTPGPAFGQVVLFDKANLLEAFNFLLLSKQRVCVIVPMTETFETESKNMKLISRRQLPVSILVSDSVVGNRATAFLGDAKTPGASGLAELVLPAVVGQLLPNPSGVVSEPLNISVMDIKDSKEKLPNRITVVIEITCRGGRLEAAANPVI